MQVEERGEGPDESEVTGERAGEVDPLSQTVSLRQQNSAQGMVGESLLDAGTMLGRYRVVREIGRGGMGAVYEAEDPQLKRRVALKVVVSGTRDSTRRGDGDSSEEIGLKRFLREGELSAKLTHPNIVAVHDTGASIVAGRPVHFLAMELVEGRDLAEMMPELSIEGRLNVLREVVAAVAYAHEQGVVHRDLKPANVLIGHDGRALVTDFGLARHLRDDLKLTRTGAIFGTVLYMAPEQVEGVAAWIGTHTDVWALGVMLYEMLTDRMPFEGASPAQVFQYILEEEPVRPRQLRGDVPEDLEVICLHALEKDPRRRYASAGALLADLERWSRGEAVSVRAPSALYRLARGIRRRQALISSAALALTLALALGLTTLDRVQQRTAAEGIFREVHVQLKNGIPAMFEQAGAVLRRLAGYAHDGRIELDRSGLRTLDLVEDPLGAELLRELVLDPRLAWVSFSSAEGDFVGAMRWREDGGIWAARSFLEGGQTRERKFLLVDGALEDGHPPPYEPPPHYDPRTRGFYRLAAGAEDVVWTEPYVFWGGLPGITGAVAVRHEGETAGVFTVDFDIWQLSRQLEQLTVSGGRMGFEGTVCLVTPDMRIVAHSREELIDAPWKVAVGSGESAERLKIDRIHDPLVQALASEVEDSGSFLLDAPDYTSFGFRHDGAAYRASVRRCALVGIDLHALVIVPSSSVNAVRPYSDELHWVILAAWGMVAVAFVALPFCCFGDGRSYLP